MKILVLDVLIKIQKKVKEAGLWLHKCQESGAWDLVLTRSVRSASYEEMNRSIFGPVCFNCKPQTTEICLSLIRLPQKNKRQNGRNSIIDGAARSSFVMTELHPGSGSDPSMMLTKAEPVEITGKLADINGLSPEPKQENTCFNGEDVR